MSEQQDSVLAAISRGVDPQVACNANGLELREYYAWKREGSDAWLYRSGERMHFRGLAQEAEKAGDAANARAKEAEGWLAKRKEFFATYEAKAELYRRSRAVIAAGTQESLL